MYINSNHKSQCQPCCSSNQSCNIEEPLNDHITQALMYSRKLFPLRVTKARADLPIILSMEFEQVVAIT
jgi:hypothetical protein